MTDYGSEFIHHTHLLNKGVKHHCILILFILLDISVSLKSLKQEQLMRKQL